MKYALITNNTVANVIAADESFIDSIRHEYQHIVNLEDHPRAGIGDSWDGTTFTKPVPQYDLDRLSADVRDVRNQLLSESDWTQLSDSPLDVDGKLAWALYRETLRMIPQQDGFPEEVNWPPAPQ